MIVPIQSGKSLACRPSRRRSAGSGSHGSRAACDACPTRLLVWLERSRQRRDLGAMDDRMLRDIGVSRSAAFAETQKWFWQP